MKDRVSSIIAQHGGLRVAARALQLDHAYLSRLLNGSKDNPSWRTLKKLGLKKVVTTTYVVDGETMQARRRRTQKQGPYKAGATVKAKAAVGKIEAAMKRRG